MGAVPFWIVGIRVRAEPSFSGAACFCDLRAGKTLNASLDRLESPFKGFGQSSHQSLPEHHIEVHIAAMSTPQIRLGIASSQTPKTPKVWSLWMANNGCQRPLRNPYNEGLRFAKTKGKSLDFRACDHAIDGLVSSPDRLRTLASMSHCNCSVGEPYAGR